MKSARRYDGEFSKRFLPPEEKNFRGAPAATAIISIKEETLWPRSDLALVEVLRFIVALGEQRNYFKPLTSRLLRQIFWNKNIVWV